MDIYFRDCPSCGARQRVDVEVDRRGQLVDLPVRCECERDPNQIPLVLEMEKRRMSGKANGKVPAAAVSTWTPSSIRAFVRDFLANVPDATNAEMWEAITKRGDPGIKFATFNTYHVPKVRREIERDGEPETVPSMPTVAATAPEPPAPKASWSKMIEEAGLTARLYERPGSSNIWLSIVADDGRKMRRSLYTSDRPVAERRARTIAKEMAREPVVGEVESHADTVAFACGGDSFRATRGDDGHWDVELRGHVDHDLMGRLAGVMWERVVGRGKVA